MKGSIAFACALLTLAIAMPSAAQQVRLEGYFIALSNCEATQKKDGGNPGNIRLEVRHAYDMIGRNSTPGSHYQIKIPDAPITQARWVPMGCGTYAPKDSLVISQDQGQAPGAQPPGTGASSLAPDSIEYVLAASWQPTFCATAKGRDKKECRSQTPDRFDATHFALHGLWPDDLDDTAIFPCYCGRGGPVSCTGSQDRDTQIRLSPEVMNELKVAMPGVQSGLHLHEWPKHGACYESDKSGPDAGTDPDEYFTEAMAALKALNASGVRQLFAEHLGQTLTREQIQSAFDNAFGTGAGERVLIRCSKVGGDNLIAELWINLKGDIAVPADLGKLIQAAPPTSRSTDQTSCAKGRVQAVR
ncbi:ribonuclease T2 family protein [Thiorhodococcus fuscus]|uniref:Ribonuclease I n=1 Tax=Thiorhodococcus fuscus TaxID=527200 RepID=A0ABW4YED0_9GAMM